MLQELEQTAEASERIIDLKLEHIRDSSTKFHTLELQRAIKTKRTE